MRKRAEILNAIELQSRAGVVVFGCTFIEGVGMSVWKSRE
jgi:hypothetical protein